MKFKSIFRYFLFANICLLMTSIAYGQENESELKSMAEKSFRSENYVEASKFYSQLLSINRDDPFYNYRYGICLLYNSRKKIDAIKHLNYASKAEGFDPEVFFYLGKAYHLNYEFGEAIKFYNVYKTKAGTKLNVTLDVNHQIEMSESGKRLLSSANEIIVLDKKEIESPSFFRIYDLKDIGGDILVNAQFQSKIDKKKKHTPIIHFPAKPTTIYYSSYGEDEKNGKDIYIRRKLPDGSWSLPQTVNGGVNTRFDEDYPYMHPNGQYLYFCSKGHNSMGGFDVFRSKFDKESNSFGPAENLDFTISSPDDDLFYVVDSLDKTAYFASARQSLDGKIHVYKVRVEQVPIQIAVIKAAFNSTIRPDNKKVSVEIYDFATNAKIGSFNSTEKGNVLMTFPKGGKYEYQIKVDGTPEVFKSVINVPFLNEFKPLKQKLVHEQVDGKETVTILNLFNEAVEDPQATMADIARIRAELNPNSDQFDLKKLDNSSGNKQLYAELGFPKQGDREVQENMEKLAVNQEKQAESLRSTQQKAIDIVMENSGEIKQLQADLKSTVSQAEIKSGDEKKALFEKAAGIVNELNVIDQENKKLLAFADSLNAPVAKNSEEAQKARKLADEVKKAFQENNTAVMGQKLSENKAAIKEMQQESSEPGVKELLAKRDEVKKLAAKQKEFLDMKINTKKELLDLDIQLAEAKSKDQPVIEKKIRDKQEELKMIEEELKAIDPKLIAKKEELKQAEGKLLFVQEVLHSKAPESKTNAVDASKTLLALDNPNTRTLKSYVGEQSKQLGIDMTAQKVEKTDVKSGETASQELSPAQKDIASQLTPDYLRNKEAIKNDKELGEEDRLKFGQKEDKNLKFQLSKEVNAVKEALRHNPNDPVLQARLKSLEELNNVLNQNIVAVQDELYKKFPESNPQKKITDKQMANRVKPNHFAVLSIIEDDNTATENQKLDKAQKEDQEFLRLLTLEKNKIGEKLKKEPADETAGHELNIIKSLLKETEIRIERRTMGMASYDIPDNRTDESYMPKNTKSDSIPENALTDTKDPENKLTDPKTDPKNPENKLPENKIENKDPENALTDTKTPENKLTDPKTDPKNPENKLPENKIENKNPENTLTDRKDPQNNLSDTQTDVKNPESTFESKSIPIDYEAIKTVSPGYEKATGSIKNNPAYKQEDKNTRLIVEENKLQKSIDNELLKIDTKLQKNPSDTAAIGQKERLNAMKQASEDRENESKQLAISAKKENIGRGQLIASADKAYQKEIAGLKPEESIAREEKLQQNLQNRIAANEKRNSLNENIDLQAENQVLQELIDESRGRAEVIRNTQLAGTNTKEKDPLNPVSDNKGTLNTASGDSKTAEMNSLKEKENELKNKLGDPKLSKTDEKILNTELAVNQQQQIALQEENNKSRLTMIQELYPKNPASFTKNDEAVLRQDFLALENASRNEAEIADLQKELAKTKKESRKAELLEEIKAKQAENTAIYEDVAYSRQMISDLSQLQSIDPTAGSLSLESKSSLESRKTVLKAQPEAIMAQIEKDRATLKTAKSNEKAAIARNIVTNEQRIALLNEEIRQIEAEQKNRTNQEALNLVEATPKSAYSEEDKQRLSTLPAYADMKSAYEKQEEALRAKASAYKAMEEAKSIYAGAVAEQAKNPGPENSQRVKAALDEVLRTSKAYQEASSGHDEARNTYLELTNSENSLSTLESLFRDGVEANYKAVEEKTEENVMDNKLATESVPFKILDVPQESSVEERVKIGEEMPMGLVYRVQVGAFRKPLKSRMYAEFTPVTGETIKEGITRYITGYFGSIQTASSAKKSIRSLGYHDAFVVAYCDGKRISLAKAKKLQASGQCIPKPEYDQQINFNTTAKTTEKTPVKSDEKTPVKNDTKTPVKADVKNPEKTSETAAKPKYKTDYNKAAGAVSAIPVETKPGLFYTVQIGAYRKPATAKQLKYVENVVSKLLPDGLIRYSTGIFPSVEAAIPTQNAAVQKGITDAFVTAYYNGERISVAEAERLLREKGEGILEKP